MGYVNLTDICQYIAPSAILKTAGAWTPTCSLDIVSDVRTAADASFTLLIPIQLPASAVGLQCAKLQSIDIWYKIATAAADDFATVDLVRATLPASGSDVSAAVLSVSCDADHATAAERKAVGSHKLTVTLASDLFIKTGQAFWLVLTIDAAATTVFSLYGAQANFDLRL